MLIELWSGEWKFVSRSVCWYLKLEALWLTDVQWRSHVWSERRPSIDTDVSRKKKKDVTKLSYQLYCLHEHAYNYIIYSVFHKSIRDLEAWPCSSKPTYKR